MHEILEIHELLTLKTSCATKAATLLEPAKDDKLKALIEED
ncbi:MULTISPECIES: hypothetical protein [unclassified Paenibacillus]|nr:MULTISPECIES: hypothetical protein [unclassified Paenibacillus]MDF9854840.1 hypothetical protein [Paenibacillus sp. PastF-1]MDF9841681.1 hypothetical protein [Paenibacillus sp. PastF-2]MDF9848207.1 hypothetical protein [Paenibacillus sp. PastM-2]MDH6480110.1 hypothetical protein [Paenibacillus sp. PastH-2]MDH6507542.1 hypothetical protein [Paenibacillus sp. PastM-3]